MSKPPKADKSARNTTDESSGIARAAQALALRVALVIGIEQTILFYKS